MLWRKKTRKRWVPLGETHTLGTNAHLLVGGRASFSGEEIEPHMTIRQGRLGCGTVVEKDPGPKGEFRFRSSDGGVHRYRWSGEVWETFVG